MEHVFDPISRVMIDFGFFVWYKYSFMIMLGIIIAAILGIREGRKLNILDDDIYDGLLIFVPGSIVAVRLWYVIWKWSNYSGNLGKIINITDGGLAIQGAIIFVGIGVPLYCKYKKLNPFNVIDLVAPGFLIAQFFGRWGNFFNQEAHGEPIGGLVEVSKDVFKPILDWDAQREFLENTLHLPNFITNQMFLLGEQGLQYYHPTFLYEGVFNLIGFGVLLLLRRTKIIRTGELMAIYLMWYGVVRFFVEGMRTDPLTYEMFGQIIRVSQAISVGLFLVGAVLMVLIRVKFKPDFYYVSLKKHKITRLEHKVELLLEETDEETKELNSQEIEDLQKEIEVLKQEINL